MKIEDFVKDILTRTYNGEIQWRETNLSEEGYADGWRGRLGECELTFSQRGIIQFLTPTSENWYSATLNKFWSGMLGKAVSNNTIEYFEEKLDEAYNWFDKKIIVNRVRCIDNYDGMDLEINKIYDIIPDKLAERENLIRVTDESGTEHLYPGCYFIAADVEVDDVPKSYGYQETEW